MLSSCAAAFSSFPSFGTTQFRKQFTSFFLFLEHPPRLCPPPTKSNTNHKPLKPKPVNSSPTDNITTHRTSPLTFRPARSSNQSLLERKTKKRKKIFATQVLGDVLEQMSKEVSPEDAEMLIPEELKRVMASDAAMTEDLVAYNIIHLDTTSVSNFIVTLLEVQASVSALKYFRELPRFPGDFPFPSTRAPDMLYFLQYVFGFQVSILSNVWKEMHESIFVGIKGFSF